MTQAIKRVPVIGWFGVALLAFSAGYVVWVMNANASQPTEGASPPPAPTGALKTSGCYGYVDVEPGVAKLYPLQPGRVNKVAVHDNDLVEKDALLLMLDDTTAKANLARARAALKGAEYDLEKAKFLPKEHEAKLAAQTAAIAAKKSELEAATQKRDLAKRIFNDRQGGAQKEDVDATEAMVRGLTEAVKAEEAKLNALQAFDPTIDGRRAEEQIKDKQAQLELAEFALRECTLKAPSKGTVLRITAADGDVLGPNPKEPAVLFCPDQPRIIRAEIEQEFANRLFLNQTAVIKDDSTNAPLIHGKVTRISDWYSHRRSMVQEPLQFNDVRTLECIITLDPNEKATLRIGQRVRVTMEAGK